MGRCRCGAALVPDLHFCVACGARQEPVRVPVGAGAPHAGAIFRGAIAAGPAPAGPVPPPPAHPRPHPPAYAVAGPVAAPGVPTTPSRSTVPWIVAGVSIVVAVVLVAVGVLAARPVAVFGAPAPAPVVVPTVTVGVPVPAVVSSERGSYAGSATTRSATAGGSTSARSALSAQVAADRATVEGLVGQWVPQLSAKRDGLVADGITYDDDAILAHWSALLGRDPSAVLLYSGDWPVFNGSDFWVALHPQGFSTAAGANAWCAAQGYAADDCYAKKLLHTGGPSGTTVTRN